MNDAAPEQWEVVDRYLADHALTYDDPLTDAVAASSAAGLPRIAVSPTQGKLLHVIARACGARRILELGTLAGYSTIWLGRALPADGLLLTIERDPRHAEVARANIERAGVTALVELRVGKAADVLAELASEEVDPFDMIFIDVDLEGTADYFSRSLDLARPGTVIIVDNVVRSGAIIEDTNTDPGIEGMRQFQELIARERRVSATSIQTVGVKGHDGFSIAIVEGS